MSAVPTREMFRSIYAGQAPWDIPKAQKAFIDAADQIKGNVLDAGCGTGENALWFASHGRQVMAFDYLEEPIARARRKVIERGVWATFLVKDALTLATWDERFDSVTDSGLFHSLGDGDRQRYIEGLSVVVKPGGRLFLMCFSDQEPEVPGARGPRRISQAELRETFRDGWSVESIVLTRVEIHPDIDPSSFSEGGPKAWFAVLRRESRPTIQGVVETVVYAEDLDAIEAFYSTVLDLKVIEKEPGRHVFFRAGFDGVFLVFNPEATMRGDKLPGHGASGSVHFALAITADSYDVWRSRLADRGVAVEREIVWPLGGKSMYFRDPAGNLGELITPGVWGTPAGW
jgi:ubiquinone/menaquinone biosynthesis C-methylase UbiE/catechol 2,3-dioxygenase-like lactoylglutathione lyase family enzyme